MMNNRTGALTGLQISREILRPFLFFINYLSVRYGKIGARHRDSMISCFKIVLEDITSNGKLLFEYQFYCEFWICKIVNGYWINHMRHN